jgi:hypothetical protein
LQNTAPKNIKANLRPSGRLFRGVFFYSERRQKVTDEQIEKLIMNEIEKRGITFYDMVGMSNQNIDPRPEDKSESSNKRARRNRFEALLGGRRIIELLCVREYNLYEDLAILKISFQDLFRFWWNNCVVKELVVEEVLDDIFDYFTDLMSPKEEEKEKMDFTLEFNQIQLSGIRLKDAA